MYQVRDNIADQEFDGLKAQKIFVEPQTEVLSISLEKGAEFPEHTSPRDAFLVVLEGTIEFHINNQAYPLKKNQTFKFPARVPHHVNAYIDSKFLIIR